MLNKIKLFVRCISWKVWVAAAVFLALLVALPSLWDRQGHEAQAGKIKPVKTMVMNSQNEAISLEYLGTVTAVDLAKYSFKIPGRLERILAEKGQAVVSGQALLQLETQDLRLALEAANNTRLQAQSAFVFAEENHNKMTRLLEAGAVSAQDLDQAKVQLDSLRAAYNNAELDCRNKENALTDSTLKAGFDGYVAGILYEEGEMVPAGYPAVVLRGVELEVTVGVSQQDWSKVKTGQTARIYALDKELSGTVASVGQLPDTQINTYPVTIAIEDSTLPVGAPARVTLEVGTEQGMFAPITAISNDGEDFVYVLDPDRIAHRKTIRLGRIKGSKVLIEGLAEGEEIVSEGGARLKDGEQVAVQE